MSPKPRWAFATWRHNRSRQVWLGGGVIVCLGVAIGAQTVVGAVGTRDLPANVLAVGNPARVIRSLEARP
jgi:acetyltransferase-like isoleucine patch superfamily enzyme